MGLFDYIRVEYFLGQDEVEFQSKSLSRSMILYTITERGLLLQHSTEDRNLTSLCNHTGVVKFYTSEGEHPNLVWIEFNAIFKEGKLTALAQTSPVYQDIPVDASSVTREAIKHQVDELLDLFENLPNLSRLDTFMMRCLELYQDPL